MSDFESFRKRVKTLMGNNERVKDIITVFQWYFLNYEKYMQKQHPNLKDDQIVKIASKMFDEYDVEDYGLMIRKHFLTKYRSCDYNINHFFSGRIREMRHHEII